MISHHQIEPLLQAHRAGLPLVDSSADLGLSSCSVELTADGAVWPHGLRTEWPALQEMLSNTNACYLVDEQGWEPIQVFSELTDRFYSLFPTGSAPTMLVGGFTMHRIKGTDPLRDTHAKIRASSPLRGRVLDTTTGLGYTAIEAAKTADHVVTVELDPAAQEIARCNPWSSELFGRPNIEQLIGDSGELIETFEDDSFSAIVHDPPVFSLAGELYSGAFYRQAFRVLRRNGHMFHYLGNPDSKSGAGLLKGVTRRLLEAGFARVVPRPEAFGVVALKRRGADRRR